MAPTADLSTRARWGSYVQGGSANQIRDENGGVYVECRDGNNAPWNGTPGQMSAEVVQVQSGHVFPYGERRWLDFEVEYLSVAPYSSQDWHFICEDHLSAAGTSARFAINLQTIDGKPHHQFVYTPYGFARRYPLATRRPITVGERLRMTIEFLPHVSGGYFAVFYDGEQVFSVQGQTSAAVASSYMKIGPYRPVGVNGLDAARFYGMKVYDANPLGGVTPPPPPAGDTVKPVIVNVLAPAGPGPFHLDALPFDFEVVELDPGVDIWVGLGGLRVHRKLDGPGRHQGVIDCTRNEDGTPSGIAPGTTVYPYIAATDSAGNDAAAWSTMLMLGTVPVPEPPADPDITFTAAQVETMRQAQTVIYNGLDTAIKRWSVLGASHRRHLTALQKRAQSTKDILD